MHDDFLSFVLVRDISHCARLFSKSFLLASHALLLALRNDRQSGSLSKSDRRRSTYVKLLSLIIFTGIKLHNVRDNDNFFFAFVDGA